MESAYILGRFNFCIIITLTPFQITPFLGIQNLDNGVLVLPWEDGNNPTAYVICPHCRHKNTVYGYGEDDD